MAERSPGLELLRIAFDGDRAIDALTASLGAAVAASIERHARELPDGTRRIDPSGYRRVMRDVDREIARIYGNRRGTDSPMYRAIADAATGAYAAAAGSQARAVRRRLRGEPELLAILTGADAE